MRHLIGIVLAIVMAGVLFFAGAWGYLKLTTGPLRVLPPGGGGSLLSDHHVLLAMAAVAGTGLLAGILIAAPRISPLAAGLPGLVLLAWTVLYLAGVHRAVQLVPLKSHPYGAGFEAMLAAGILGAAGLAMIVRCSCRPGGAAGPAPVSRSRAGRVRSCRAWPTPRI